MNPTEVRKKVQEYVQEIGGDFDLIKVDISGKKVKVCLKRGDEEIVKEFETEY